MSRTANRSGAVNLSTGSDQAHTSGNPVLPLFARDESVREEVCGNCQRSLAGLLAATSADAEQGPVIAALRVRGSRSALEFERIPPLEVRTALKATGWRWDSRLGVWWLGDEVPPVPAGGR